MSKYLNSLFFSYSSRGLPLQSFFFRYVAIAMIVVVFLIRILSAQLKNTDNIVAKQIIGEQASGRTNFADTVEEAWITLTELREIMDASFSSYTSYEAELKEIFQGKLRQGKLFIKKPHSLRLTYYSNNSIDVDVYGSGEYLYVYLPQYGIVYEQDLVDAGGTEFYSIQEAKLEALFENYNFRFTKDEMLTPVLSTEDSIAFNVFSELEPNTYQLSLVAKDITRGFDSMTIWITPQGQILRSRSESIDKKIVDIYFYNILLDKEIPQQTFELILDPSVKILKNSLK